MPPEYPTSFRDGMIRRVLDGESVLASVSPRQGRV